MSEQIIYNLLYKIGQRQHMEELFNEGKLYMNTLSYYRTCENEFMRDSHEGLDFIMQMREVTLRDLASGKLLKGPATIFGRNNDPKGNVFCLHGIKRDYLQNRLHEKFKMPFKSHVFTGGDTAVLIWDIHKFLERVKTAMEREKRTYQYGPVLYYDPKITHDQLDCFDKDIFFQDQDEVRFFVPTDESGHIEVFLGDVRDIATILPIEQLNHVVYEWVPETEPIDR